MQLYILFLKLYIHVFQKVACYPPFNNEAYVDTIGQAVIIESST